MALNRGTTLVIGAFAVIVSASHSAAAYMPNNDGKIIWGAEQQTPRYVRHATRPRHHHRKVSKRKHKKTYEANRNVALPWNMVKVKTVQGFYITVHPAYAHKFLRFFEILAQNNVKIPEGMVGCFSRRGHVPGSNHYIGAACDIQTGWNRTIPAMYHAGKWIRQAGLYDGCSFGDCGHIEGIRGTHNAKRVPNLYAALEKFKADEATANYQP